MPDSILMVMFESPMFFMCQLERYISVKNNKTIVTNTPDTINWFFFIFYYFKQIYIIIYCIN